MPNRLSGEKSPYLLQHAGNPVDWYPWGTEAFARAAAEDKPIFLSIGYSTCHWCHVMERESFEDDEVAALMNQAFVNVKVDREERPDVDNIYMTVAQMLTGQGGWPLTIVMTPAQQPFFAATYIPKTNRFGRPGMLDVIPRIRSLWEQERHRLLQSAVEITDLLGRTSELEAGTAVLDTRTLDLAYRQLAQAFDARHGGFGRAPKFPSPHTLLFLLRYWARTGQREALDMVTSTLTAMRRGGIYDHVGFGFHRYSTDPTWLVPHFEKMLYDQAMLVLAYAEGFQATRTPLFRRTVEETCTYVLRDLGAPDGGFYSAEDADSEGEEGKFYVWTHAELAEVLPPDDVTLVIDVFGVEESGNFHEEASRKPTGANILHLRRTVAEGSSEAVRLERARERLLASRQRRERPLRDDKVLADWNGLMIAALAVAARALDDEHLGGAAQRAARFVIDRMMHDGDRLYHRFKDDHADLEGYLDDYAFVVWGLLELHQTVFDTAYLQRAIALTDAAERHFRDDRTGSFFFTADDGERLLVRRRETYDGAIPSANSVMLSNLLRLARLTGRTTYEERAHRLLEAVSREVATQPLSHTQMLAGLDRALGPTQEVVVVAAEDADGHELLGQLGSAFTPRAVVHYKPATDAGALAAIAPFTADLTAVENQAAAYVCQDFQCDLPVTDAAAMLTQLGVVTPEP